MAQQENRTKYGSIKVVNSIASILKNGYMKMA